MSNSESTNQYNGLEVAVIGMAGRFPGAADIDAFWNNLEQGVESIHFFSEEELKDNGVKPEIYNDPDYVNARGVLEGIEYFDASFFGYTPKEAEVMDPQIRLFHRYAWMALENAGYTPDGYDGLIGLFAGAAPNFGWQAQVELSGKQDHLGQFITNQLADKDFLGGRVSHRLNLKGPGITLYSACSTSLAAIHLAYQSLLNGECDMALAGGVNLSHWNLGGYLYQEGGLNSPDGHCRAFDAGANGTVGGNGVAAVLLKPLEEAMAEGDHIWAVIKGSAINNDGARKVGFPAPSVEGQTDVISAALQSAEVEAESIGYIETQGIGTPLGDAMEVEALSLAFDSDKRGFCRIGSVKTNLGHLNATAGVAGFIKTVLALKHKRIPPSLNYKNPNPRIDFDATPFRVNNRSIEWKSSGTPLRAGVSAFGIGGTNAHVILEEFTEAAEQPVDGDREDLRLFVLSARTATALDTAAANLADFLRKKAPVNLADAAYTLQVGRKAFEYRRSVVCANGAEAAGLLESPECKETATFLEKDEKRSPVLVFPGEDTLYSGMGLELYRREPLFRDGFLRCLSVPDLLPGYSPETLAELLYPVTGAGSGNGPVGAPEAEPLLLFAFQYALATLVTHCCGRPSAMIGRGIGEYTAAHLAGVFTLEDALRLAALKGRADARMPGARDAFEAQLKRTALNKPTRAFISGVTGNWIDANRVVTPGYWLEQAGTGETEGLDVFEAGVQRLLEKEGGACFLQLAPGDTFSQSAAAQGRNSIQTELPVFNLVPGAGENISSRRRWLETIGALWQRGMLIDWPAYYQCREENRRRIPLPHYPFEEQCFQAAGDPLAMAAETVEQDNLPREKPDPEDWFYVPLWKQSVLLSPPAAPGEGGRKWLVFSGGGSLDERLIEQLEQRGGKVVRVRKGASFSNGGGTFTIDPMREDDYRALFGALDRRGEMPGHLLHLWNAGAAGGAELTPEAAAESLHDGFYSLLNTVRSIDRLGMAEDLDITVITANMQQVTGEEQLYPPLATILGAVKVIPQEYAYIRCRGIDIIPPTPGGPGETQLAGRLLREMFAGTADPVVAYRSTGRMVPICEPIKLEKNSHQPPALRPQGVYLILGGVGNIGFQLSKYLAQQVKARLVLVSRTPLPPRDQWDGPTEYPKDIARKIDKIRQLEALGAEVSIHSADIADEQRMREVVAHTLRQWGTLNGVLHAAGIFEWRTVNFLKEMGVKECQMQFNSKIDGLLALERVLPDQPLDFCILTSSISSQLGGLGHVAYAGANIFMDSFAQYMDLKGPTPWMSINWEGWKDDDPNHIDSTLGESVRRLALKQEEGVEAFSHILPYTGGLNRLVVTKGDLLLRLRRWTELQARKGEWEPGPGDESQHPRPELPTPYAPASSATEGVMATLWRQLLGFKQVGVDDDFFQLGGDSLKGLTVLSRIHRELNVKVPIEEMFAHPTIRELSRYVDHERKDNRGRGYIPVGAAEKREYYPLSSAQKRIYFFQQINKDTTSYNMPMAVVVEGNLVPRHLEYTFKQLMERHESLRTSFRLVEKGPVQVVHDNPPFQVEYREAAEQEAHQVVTAFVRPFDLGVPPLLRVGLIKTAPQRHILMVDMHHTVSDGVSITILFREFTALYGNRTLPPLRLQYKDFSQWQNSAFESGQMKRQEEYWLSRFNEPAPLLRLPLDFPRPAARDIDKGAHIVFDVPPAISQKVVELGKQTGTTLFMILLAVYNVLLSKYTHQEDIVVGSPVTGRSHQDLQQILGVFINMVALRNRPANEKTFADFLGEVKGNALDAFENQDYPFDQLILKLGLQGDTSRNPLFETEFSVDNLVQSAEENDGFDLVIEDYPNDTDFAKFDLHFTAYETEEGISIMLRYSTEMFKPSTIETMAGHYLAIMEQAMDNIHIRLQDITSRQFVETHSNIYKDDTDDFDL